MALLLKTPQTCHILCFMEHFCPNIYPPLWPRKIYGFNWRSTCVEAVRNVRMCPQPVYIVARIPAHLAHVCWTHTFVLHNVADDLSHRVVVTEAVVHIWNKGPHKKFLYYLMCRKYLKATNYAKFTQQMFANNSLCL